MQLGDFWYVVEESRLLRAGDLLSRRVLGEWLAVYRDAEGRATAVRDRCLHRSAQLSRGQVRGGELTCPYHGWVYGAAGAVVAIPSLGRDSHKIGGRCAKRYATCERDGFVYVRLSDAPAEPLEPFAMPHYGERGWKTLRLQNRFRNNVTNCAENFVDIPHTAYVHKGIFRTERHERLSATVERRNGSVAVTYHGETANLGLFGWFLNPSGREIGHVDNFHMPNITSVEYRLGGRKTFIITSQSVPVEEDETLVYTDLTYNYGFWNHLSGYLVRRYGQKIIDQDIEILNNQMEVIKKYGGDFSNSPADVIHVFIESIREQLQRGEDPRQLPERCQEIEFWV
jgi:phenylpropionate dioxygenase-like ring-hydroxylating dioxygenase large terminal subunit